MVYAMGDVMARTNIVLDEKLTAEALRITGARSKREAVDIALRRLVEQESLNCALRRAPSGYGVSSSAYFSR